MTQYEIEVDFQQITVEADAAAVDVVIESEAPAVGVALPGVQGPPGPPGDDGAPGADGATGPAGPTGIIKVTHGTDPNVARPSAPIVYWVGSATPVNAQPDDFWKDV